MIRILVIGPSIERTKGGMATVIRDALALNQQRPEVELTHLVSHVEGSVAERIMVTAKSLWYTLRHRNKFDLAHIHVASKGSFYRKSLFVHLCRLLGKPVVLHVHGADFDSFYFAAASMLRRYIRHTFRVAAQVFVLSVFWRNFFQQHITKGNVQIVHNGVDVAAFSTCISAVPDYNNFLFLGRLGKRKGVYDLLQAIEMIVAAMPTSPMHFWLAGDGEINAVIEEVRRRNLGAFVTVVGWIDGQQKLQYLKQADTMLLPSYDEGLPMSILEAMACGKVIISTFVGGIPDLIINGEHGFLIQPGDVNALAKAIRNVHEQKERMRVISAKNIDRIREHYDLNKINLQILETYQRMTRK
ncbi:glycosyltransferase family 4 protein [Paracnuella aquatica]|uniref:glycosyltransferase family 4 protein n=1 Tax=Paracnuella aquatica TaxID=2268757 RepID=UPI000F4FB4BB|nr:glycosyltransferase family 4 protein [Paracnuella aquatica]RPD47271.1 glycosyltransferase family 1 protein [Paracnuella aquatica]